MRKWLEVSTVAGRLNVSPNTVYRLIKKKKLKAMAAGVEKGYRVLSSSVEEFERARIEAFQSEFFD